MRDELIFWFDQLPKVSLGAFTYVANHWGSTVIYVVDHPLGAHRKMLNWGDGDYGKANIIKLYEEQDQEAFVKELFASHPQAIHVMNGFCSAIEGKIRPHVLKPGVKLAVMTEKPLGSRRGFTLEKWCRNRLTPLKYRRIYRQYRDAAAVVIPLGVWGKELFESYGWPEEKVFSYMYCPELRSVSGTSRATDPNQVRFLYVGRLNYAARGLDVLMKAFDRLENRNWHLDIVGGYGEKKDEIIQWADSRENVSFLGPWPSETVGVRMQEYDVYLCPTKVDGWNSQINEAINAGIGVIVTDEAVSDELVRASHAGAVVRAADVPAFSRALQSVLESPQTADQWKACAQAYRDRISTESVGNYFIDILDYSFGEKSQRPACPWL